MKSVLRLFDNLESLACRSLLVVFVTLLFAQIVSRELFAHSIPWSEELSVYLFVWFVYLGASFAAKQSAHNRVTFQFRWMSEKWRMALEALSDLIWVVFNLYLVYLSWTFVFFRMNDYWKSQTLGIPMKFVYLVLPISFALLTIRVLQVNYRKFVRHEDIVDADRRAFSDPSSSVANSAAERR